MLEKPPGNPALFETAPLGGLPAELVQFLQFQNPWWSGKPAKPTECFRRWAFAEVIDRLERSLTPAVTVRGPRQVGKTTIQNQLIEELLKLRGINPARIFRVEFDDVPLLGSLQLPILGLVQWFEKNILGDTINTFAQKGEPVYLFFDEVQNLASWAQQVKSLVDNVKAKTLIVGSSALRIAEGQDILAGRVSEIELGPLRLSEIVGVRRLGDLPSFQHSSRIEDWARKEFWLDLLSYANQHAKILRKAFDAFSDVGGYPECHKRGEKRVRGTPRAQLVDDIRKLVVERTLSHDLKAGSGGAMRDGRVLEETFRLVCRYAGQAIPVPTIGRGVRDVLSSGVSDRTIHDALKFLAHALLVYEIPPLEALVKRQPHPSKLCLCDHFVREAWFQEQVPLAPQELAKAPEAVATTAGHIIESDIGYYLKGIPGVNISWLPRRGEEPELDFVLTIGLKRIPVEAKYCRCRHAGDSAGIRWFCDQAKYNAPFGLLVTQELSGPQNEKVIAVPAYAMLCVR